MVRALRIYSLNKYHIYDTAVLANVIMAILILLVLIYLVTPHLHLLNTFIQSPLPPPRTTDLIAFLYEVFFSFLDSTHK